MKTIKTNLQTPAKSTLNGIKKASITSLIALSSFFPSAAFAQSVIKKDTLQLTEQVVTQKNNRFFGFFKIDPQKAELRKLVKSFKENYKIEYKSIKKRYGKPFLSQKSFVIFPGKINFNKGAITNDSSTVVFSNWKNAAIIGTNKNDKILLDKSKKIKYLPLAGDDSTKIENSSSINILDKEGSNFLSISQNDSSIKVTNYSPGSVIKNESTGAQIKIANTTLYNEAHGSTITLLDNNVVINGKNKYEADMTKTKPLSCPKKSKSHDSSIATLPSTININGKKNVISNYSSLTTINGRNPSTTILIDSTQR